MNRRLEDEIARLAFGDLPPARAQALERLAETDPEVKRALATYAGLRQGLKAMSPSAEHQLSSERLRREILEKGLGARPRPTFDFRWLVLPAAAAGAFFFVQSMQRPSSISNSPPVLVQAPTEDGTRVALREPGTQAPEAAAPEAVAPAPAVSSAPSTGRPVAVRRSPRTAGGIVEGATRVASRTIDLKSNAGVPSMAFAPGVAMKATADAAAPAAESFGGGVGLAGVRTAPAKPEAIVVIQPVRDAATGAFRATEVASPSNVLIGS